jgi:hypothetical protein
MQAILFQNGRALGRLVTPQLQVTHIAAAQPLGSEPDARGADCGALTEATDAPSASVRATDDMSAASAAGGRQQSDAALAACDSDTLLEVHQLVFDRWQPVWTDYKHSQRSVVLHIPVNSTWRAANYRLQVSIPPPKGFCCTQLLLLRKTTRHKCNWIQLSQHSRQRMSTIHAGHWQGPHGIFCAAGNIRDPRGPQHSRHQPAPAAVRVCAGAPEAPRHPGVPGSRRPPRQGRRSSL